MSNRVCLIKYKDQVVSDIKIANKLALEDSELAANILELSEFEKKLLSQNRLSKINGRFVVEAKNGARSKLFDSLYKVSPQPMIDYEYVHSNIFLKNFGNWIKAQEEWLSGKKTWLQAVRSNRIDETAVDENLEPRVQVLYPKLETSENKISTKKLTDLFSRAGVNVKIKLRKEKTDKEIVLENIEEAKRLLGQEVDDVVNTVISFRPDIVSKLRDIDERTRAYYDSKEKSIVYVPHEDELKSLLEQLNIKKLCL